MDTTDNPKLSADIEQLRKDRLRYVSELSAGLAHELNQPLSGISMFAENILFCLKEQMPLSNDEISHAMTRIIEQTERITNIIDHLRDFARDKERQETMPVEIRKVIDSAIKLLKTQLANHDIILDIVETPSEPTVVCANPFALEEVIMNLITNARDALDEKDAPPKQIIININVDETTCMLKVSDTGIGIKPTDLENIFNPFFTTKGPDRGIGLGLAVAKGICESFNGSLTIDSIRGEGTTATLRLPLHQSSTE